MKRLVLLATTTLALAGFAFAGVMGGAVPEIDPSQAVTALALLSGGALVLRGRRRNSSN